MRITENTKKCFEFLKKWEAKDNMFNLMTVISVEIIPEIIESNFFSYYSKIDVSPIIKNKFYYFAVDGAGGEYALWDNEMVKNEHPVVYLESEGQYKMLAPSLYDFIASLPNKEGIRKLKKEGNIEGVIDDYEDKYGISITEKKAKNLLLKDVELFVSEVEKLPKSLHSNLTEKDFFEMLKLAEQESDKLFLLLNEMRKVKNIELDKLTEKTIVQSIIYHAEQEYESLIYNGTKWTDNYVFWFLDKIEVIYELSLNGYTAYLPEKKIFLKWMKELDKHLPNIMKDKKKKKKRKVLEKVTKHFEYLLNN